MNVAIRLSQKPDKNYFNSVPKFDKTSEVLEIFANYFY